MGVARHLPLPTRQPRSAPEQRLRCARRSLGIACIPMKQYLRNCPVYEDHQASSQNVAIPMTFGREILP